MLNLTVPNPIYSKLEELLTLVEEHPETIPVSEVAKFLSMDAENLRTCIEQNRCPFGISWQKTIHGNKAFKIPVVPFFMWYTQGVYSNSAVARANK